MNKNLVFGLFLHLVPTVVMAGGKLDIEVKKECESKVGSSAEIEVTVRDEEFDFNPSCAFSFSEKFKTEKGVECKIEAGMCSPFSPKNQFVVECADGSKESAKIKCPK